MPSTDRTDIHLEKCSKCSSTCLVSDLVFFEGGAVEETKCQVCGYRPPRSVSSRKRLSQGKKHILVPSVPSKPQKSADPPDRSCYLLSLHFYKMAQQFHAQRRKETSRSKRAQLLHRRNLFNAITITLEQLRKSWRRICKHFYVEQRKTGRIPAIEDGGFNTVRRNYELLMRQAMVLAPDDPAVKQFAEECRALGARKFLRGARKGLEKDVQAPYPTPAKALADSIIVEIGDTGCSPGEIRRKLIARGLPSPSREGIRKRIKAYSKEIQEIQRQRPRS